MLRTAASPLFLRRIADLVEGVEVSVADCGTTLVLRRSASEGRTAAACEAPAGGVCAACWGEGARVGDPAGRQAVEAWREALRAYQERLGQGREGAVRLRWPSFTLGDPGQTAGLRTVDLPGGMEYLADLLEARSPRDAAIMSELDGVVSLQGERHGKRQVVVTATYEHGGSVSTFDSRYLLPEERALRVSDGDRVVAGEPLSEGEPCPHQILRILGELRLVGWMTDEVQGLLGALGVRLDDRAVALVLRAMLREVRIVNAGEASFAVGELVDRGAFFLENERLLAAGKLAACAECALLGISKAAERRGVSR